MYSLDYIWLFSYLADFGGTTFCPSTKLNGTFWSSKRTSNSLLYQENNPKRGSESKIRKNEEKTCKDFFTGLSRCPSAALFWFSWALNRISRLWLPNKRIGEYVNPRSSVLGAQSSVLNSCRNTQLAMNNVLFWYLVNLWHFPCMRWENELSSSSFLLVLELLQNPNKLAFPRNLIVIQPAGQILNLNRKTNRF